MAHPALVSLKEEDETTEDLLKLNKEELLLRWVNYQLRRSASYVGEPVRNFDEDVKDSVAYVHLMREVAPADCEPAPTLEPLKETDLLRRAERTLAEAEKIDCREFLNAQEIVAGHKKLNMA